MRGEVWAWPTMLIQHNAAFAIFPPLADYTCRWRQWEPGGKIDFDKGCSEADKDLVTAWVSAASA